MGRTVIEENRQKNMGKMGIDLVGNGRGRERGRGRGGGKPEPETTASDNGAVSENCHQMQAFQMQSTTTRGCLFIFTFLFN